MTLTRNAALLLLATVSVPAFAAPAPPNAGQTIRELQAPPAAAAPDATAPVSIKNETVKKPASKSTAKIPVKKITIEGNTKFSSDVLQLLVKDLENSTHTLAELNDGAAAITDYYRQHGYIVARAYLPAQKMNDGSLLIRVLEGGVGKQTAANKSLISDSEAKGYIDNASTPGQVLNSEPVDRSLLLLADTPGVGGAHTILRPGASVGTTDLIVELDPGKQFEAEISANNFGNRYTGKYLLDGQVAWNSPLNIGDQLTVRALHSNDHLMYGRAAYSLPVGHDGLRAGVSYGATGYRLGEEFGGLGANGNAGVASVYTTYPFIRSLTANLYGTAALEDKRLNDFTETPVTESRKTVDNINLGLSGNYQDKIFGGGVTSLSLGVIHGNLDMDPGSRLIDDVTARTAGYFTRVTYRLSRLQQVTENDFLVGTFSGQQANKNLNSSEEMSLGGIDGVRAYPQNEGAGDQGWLGNFEVRHNFGELPYVPKLQAIAFYDIGSVEINNSNYTTSDNTRTIAGAGFGFNATTVGGIDLQTFLAWRTGGGKPQSDPNDPGPRIWFQVSRKF